MPIYEYLCGQCSHSFEIQQGIKEKPLKECPECTGAIERLLFAVSSKISRDTLGKLAEKNTKKMGSKLQTKEADDKAKAKAHMRELNRINRMTPEQKTAYIERG